MKTLFTITILMLCAATAGAQTTNELETRIVSGSFAWATAPTVPSEGIVIRNGEIIRMVPIPQVYTTSYQRIEWNGVELSGLTETIEVVTNTSESFPESPYSYPHGVPEWQWQGPITIDCTPNLQVSDTVLMSGTNTYLQYPYHSDEPQTKTVTTTITERKTLHFWWDGEPAEIVREKVLSTKTVPYRKREVWEEVK